MQRSRRLGWLTNRDCIDMRKTYVSAAGNRCSGAAIGSIGGGRVPSRELAGFLPGIRIHH